MTYKILHGNNLDILPTLADNSIDSIVTDPPYELGFMGKKWDSSGIAYSVELWQQCLRVLKPGGHLLSFGGTRTYHRVAVAIEDAGFELRDSIAWLYGSGFPKSLDVSKAIDKQAGAEREVLTEVVSDLFGDQEVKQERKTGIGTGKGSTAIMGDGNRDLTMPATPEAQQWQGWGTALKPAFEPVIVARKPIEGTVANNVLKWGTGGLNIDGSRIDTQEGDYDHPGNTGKKDNRSVFGTYENGNQSQPHSQGRWPANIILDPYTAELLDEQSGQVKGNPGAKQTTDFRFMNDADGKQNLIQGDRKDIGGASRFFYVAKASKRDRNEGLEELEESLAGSYAGNVANKGNKIGAQPDKPNQPAKNFHPTVKPTALMQYLVKLVTPPAGTVLDPFTGSGSTGKAAILEGFDFIGIEVTEDYWPIIEGRLKHAEAKVAEAKENQEAEPQGLF
jgi:site-specific DNA-methyltransferase (adenine-specific)